ncbi:peptidoglycan DD-metalloendopeptidase family protein [Siminovitchia fortis]|uniref:peptidoglycan DD-metalloendopeptidase family protein n=1 Tax=Siminovitchia fortis TaxID=254758 RepID=UPI0011A3A317|nr:peptidoglycan DD-metalloendopeptidase family protein [Siminovitchia fortis]
MRVVDLAKKATSMLTAKVAVAVAGAIGFVGGLIILLFFILLLIIVGIAGAGSNTNTDSEGGDYTWGGTGNFAVNEVPKQYIPLYQKAAQKYNLDWELLAAIHRVETVFSTINPMISYVGAEGHAQFMPCTWVGWGHPSCGGLGKGNIPQADKSNPTLIKKYGGYGVDANGDGKADMWDLEDAIFGMANYLSASYKATGTIDGAILRYNASSKYLSDVKHYMSAYKSNLVAVDHLGNHGSGVVVGNKAWPVPHTKNITSGFGPRWGTNHNGIDIAGGNDTGKPIVAFMEGKVVVSTFGQRGSGYGGYGYVVVIDHGNGVSTLYGHMLEKGIPVGTKVKAGQVIGKIGNTGDSKGAHLHFEVRINNKPVDPMPYLKPVMGKK